MMRSTALLQVLLVSCVALSSAWSGGCVSSGSQIGAADGSRIQEAAALGPVPAGMARVVFTRGWNLFGAAVSHFVTDRGDGAITNAVLLQAQDFPDSKGNFDIAMNVERLYLKLDARRSRLLVGRQHLPNDVGVKERESGETDPSLSVMERIPGMTPQYIRRHYWENQESLSPNVMFCAIVTNGQTVHWDRPPGIMKLNVTTGIGDEAFSLPFQIEAGRTYFVDYSYMSADFAVSSAN